MIYSGSFSLSGVNIARLWTPPFWGHLIDNGFSKTCFGWQTGKLTEEKFQVPTDRSAAWAPSIDGSTEDHPRPTGLFLGAVGHHGTLDSKKPHD